MQHAGRKACVQITLAEAVMASGWERMLLQTTGVLMHVPAMSRTVVTKSTTFCVRAKGYTSMDKLVNFLCLRPGCYRWTQVR